MAYGCPQDRDGYHHAALVAPALHGWRGGCSRARVVRDRVRQRRGSVGERPHVGRADLAGKRHQYLPSATTTTPAVDAELISQRSAGLKPFAPAPTPPAVEAPFAGFALGAFHISLAVAALTIGGISVALSLIGLELGAQIGARAGQRGELLGGLVLIAVGAAIAAGLLSRPPRAAPKPKR